MQQIQQPYLMAPDATLPFEFDWNNGPNGADGWLPDGVNIAGYALSLGPGLTAISQSQSGGLVTVLLKLAANVMPGAQTQVTCKITTDQTPPLTDSRTIRITAQSR